jgi:chromosome partitioning protein
VLPNAVAVTNSKGGVGKTSVAVNLAGLAALSGWKVLLVDIDAQGNMSTDLGLDDRTDSGLGLYRAVNDGAPLEPLRDVRPNLDCILGGDHNVNLYRSFDGLDLGVPRYHRLEAALAPIASDYDLIVIDCPPGEELAQMAVLVATHFVLCPTKSDKGSINGLSGALTRAANVRKLYNPDLEILGVVLVAVGKGSKGVLRRAQNDLAARSDSRLRVFEPAIRNVEAVADACRDYGLLVHELEQAAARHKKLVLSQLRMRKKRQKNGEDVSDLADLGHMPSSQGLADDYQQLAAAVLAEISARMAVTVS